MGLPADLKYETGPGSAVDPKINNFGPSELRKILVHAALMTPEVQRGCGFARLVVDGPGPVINAIESVEARDVAVAQMPAVADAGNSFLVLDHFQPPCVDALVNQFAFLGEKSGKEVAIPIFTKLSPTSVNITELQEDEVEKMGNLLQLDPTQLIRLLELSQAGNVADSEVVEDVDSAGVEDAADKK